MANRISDAQENAYKAFVEDVGQLTKTMEDQTKILEAEAHAILQEKEARAAQELQRINNEAEQKRQNMQFTRDREHAIFLSRQAANQDYLSQKSHETSSQKSLCANELEQEKLRIAEKQLRQEEQRRAMERQIAARRIAASSSSSEGGSQSETTLFSTGIGSDLGKNLGRKE